MHVDYRALNKTPVKNNYSNWLGGAKYFSWIDLKSCYYQICITKEAYSKFVVMPLGLFNVPPKFTTLKTKVFMFIYIYNILMYSMIVVEHAEHLKCDVHKLYA